MNCIIGEIPVSALPLIATSAEKRAKKIKERIPFVLFKKLNIK
tara:strand:- start:74 stop:202 length:129 start_codon:yes stop_codon:yes gene_type:complete